MDIAIFGAGAAGSLFASRLSAAGFNVAITDKDIHKTDAISKNGIKVLSSGPGRAVLAHSYPFCAALGDVHLHRQFLSCSYYIFCVKAYSTASAAETACRLAGSDSVAVTFQNGAGNIDAISGFFSIGKIAAGTTTEGASLEEPGVVIHGGAGKTLLGMAGKSGTRGGREKLEMLLEALQKSGFACSYHENPEELIWKKLAVNSCINPLTAITGCSNLHVAENSFLREIAGQITAETCAAAEAEGCFLDRGAVLAEAFEVAGKTGANISSMLQDIRAGRKTETDYISGFIAEAGKKRGIECKASRTLNLLVKALEQKQ